MTRSRQERVVAGVCGGVGRELGLDPLLLRVVVAVLTLFGGAGAVLYAAGWLLLPVDDGEPSLGAQVIAKDRRGRSKRTVLLAVALAVVVTCGVFGVLGHWDAPVLLALVAVGFVVYVLRSDDPSSSRARATTEPTAAGVDHEPTPAYAGGATYAYAVAPPVTAAPPTAAPLTAAPLASSPVTTPPLVAPQFPSRPASAASTTTAGAAPRIPSWGGVPQDGPYGGHQPPQPSGRRPPAVPPARPRAPKPPREHSMLTGLTLSVLLVVLGALAAVDASGHQLVDGAYPAAALGVIGLGLLLGSWFGRARGVIWIGLLLTLVTVAYSATTPWADRYGDRNEVDISSSPTSVGELPGPSDYGAGAVRYDLTRVPFEGEEVSMDLEIAFGEIVVVVPRDVDVVVSASAGVGQVDLFGTGSGGLGTERSVTDLGADGEGGGTLDLDLSTGFGQVEVRRAQA